jgi:hypothetical protein
MSWNTQDIGYFYHMAISPCGRLVESNQLLVCMFGVSRGKVPFENRRVSIFNMAATATILKLVSVDYLTNAWVGPIFFWLIGGDWRKVPFDDQLWPLRQSSWIWFPSII